MKMHTFLFAKMYYTIKKINSAKEKDDETIQSRTCVEILEISQDQEITGA